MRNEQSNVAQLQQDLADKQGLMTTKQQVLATVQKIATPGAVFAQRWKAYLVPDRDQNGNAILADMSALGSENVVSVQGRKSGVIDYMWHDKPLKSHYAECKGTSDDYYRLMNWLGGLEKKWPEARFELVSFQKTGASLEMSIRLSYPAFLTDPVGTPSI